MATDAMIGHSSIYEIHDGGSPGDWDEISEVFNIVPGAETAGRVEVTHMQSPGRRREFIAGLIDSGEGTFEINWSPGSDTDVLLRTLFESGEVRQHRITFPNSHRLNYDASIIGYEKAVPVDDRITATITVAISGAATWDEAP